MWEICACMSDDHQMTNAWDQIKSNLSNKLSPEAFQNWFASTTFHRFDGDSLKVAVPNEATKQWVEKEYSEDISEAIFNLRLPVRRIEYQVAVSNDGGSSVSSDGLFQGATVQLNPKFTFDSFVVGSCNQFAHAAAKAVASKPSRSYNPLFIYGGVGMGKTHLIHAIGRSLMEQFAGMRIVYTTSEKFMNQMINCLKGDRMSQFRDYFRSADVLLVDDIQIIGGKERTQEEFFHTFNDLYDHQKQIVIASDTPPKQINGLVERLRSRFEWGLMVDVQPPDLETKMAILDAKAEQEGVNLPEDVRIYIATKTKSNVRELEGALVKLVAYSSVTGEDVTLQMAQQVLKNVVYHQDRRVTIDSIVRAVADKFSLQPGQIRQKTNARQISYPRQIAMYLAKELTPASLPEIGRAFGGKHHTTVLHSVQKIEQQRQRDQDLNRLLQILTDTIN